MTHEYHPQVIVIDDESDTRNLMWFFLKRELPEMVVVKAVGDVGWQENNLDWERTVVAIVDLRMPVTSGWDVLAWIKENHPRCYRIAWSAFAGDHAKELTEQKLAHAVVDKPGLDEMRDLVLGRIGR